MTQPVSRYSQLFLGIGAAALALLVGAVALPILLDAREWKSISTGVGGHHSQALDDGTVVELDTSTSLKAHISDTRRDVRLLHGEARFEVTHDPKRPLTVRARGTVVRVVGTTFSVRVHSDSKVTVVVESGVVVVGHEDANGSLIPEFFTRSRFNAINGTRVVAGSVATDMRGEVAVMPLSPGELDARSAWRGGLRVFQDEALEQIVSEINRYNELQIRIVDPRLAARQLSGAYVSRDPELFLQRLSDVVDIQIERPAQAGGKVIEIRGGGSGPGASR